MRILNFAAMCRAMLFLFALLCTLPEVDAQRLMSRKRPDIIPLDGQAKRIGWYVAPGITYTLPRFKNSEEEVYRNADTSFTTTYDPNGRVGIYAEAGVAWFTRDPVIVDYLDVGLAYKNLRGSERSTGQWRRGEQVDTIDASGTFAERFLTLHFNANKFIQTRDYQFVQLSLGANADYRLGSSYEHTGDPVLNRHDFPPDLIGQLHFKVGYGFKLTGNLILIPAIETPIFSFVPEDQGLGKLQWFSSTYRPLILSVRFLFLRARNGFDCPPPIKHKGDIKQYKQDGYHPK